MRDRDGFTLIELMFVISIIGILAAIAIPNFIAYRDKAYLVEGYELADPVRKDVVMYYDHRGTFPKDNASLGFPEAIKGKHVESIKVNHGTIEIKYSDKARTYKDAVIKLIPSKRKDDPFGPVVWKIERNF